MACLLALQTLACAGSLPKETRSPGVVANAFPYPRVDRLEEDPEFDDLVYVVEAGPEAAPPLVLVHGFGSNGARDFDVMLPVLSQHHRVLAFDLPGFGRSTLAKRMYSPKRYIAFIRAMIESRFADRPVMLVGHSMGGALAIGYAGTYPDGVERLAVLDVAGMLYYRDYLFELGNSSGDDRDASAKAGGTLRNAVLALPLAVTTLESLDLAERETPLPLLSIETTTAMLFIAHDFGPALYSVQAPAMVGWGKNDTIAPERTAIALHYALSPRKTVTFDSSGHVPMESEPGAVTHALRAFLSEPVPAPEPAVPFSRGRIGACVDAKEQLFEGDYDAIYLRNCEGALLRDVRTRRLWVEHSVVALQHVEVEAEETAVTMIDSRVQWTGGTVRARTCFESDRGRLNFAAVRCFAEQTSMRVFEPCRLRASISEFRLAGEPHSFHGDYRLPRSAQGSPTAFEFPLPEASTVHCEPRPPGERFYGYESDTVQVEAEIELPATDEPPPTTR